MGTGPTDTMHALAQLIGGALSRARLQRLNGFLFAISIKGLGVTAFDGTMRDERRLLRNVRPMLGDTPLVFDVGANRGQYARMVREEYPRARIHSFEPNPSTLADLQELAEQLDVTVVNKACGREDGAGTLFDYSASEGSSHASLLSGVLEKIHSRETSFAHEVPVISLDSYIEANRIERIDFLKIDVEGYELDVLTGARNALSAGKIGVVQFEFNEMNTLARTFIPDFAAALPGYRLHRLLYSGKLASLEGMAPHKLNIFGYQNIVALRA